MAMASDRLRPDSSNQRKKTRFTVIDHNPPTTIRTVTGRVKMPARGFLSGRRMRSPPSGSTAKASAGKPSVARLT